MVAWLAVLLARAFEPFVLLASEAIARRNVAAIEPDRIQTRCRDDGARAQVSRQSNRSGLLDWSARRAILIGASERGVSRCVTA
jgi:hypothetical protein